MALDVLTCTNCSAPIPFGDLPTATCPFCKHENAVPDTYREMRAAKALDAGAHTQAEAVLRKLDRPPWFITKLLAAVLDLPMFAFMLLYGVPIGLFAIIRGMRYSNEIARAYLGTPAYKEGPWWLTVTCMFSILFFIIFVPRVFGIFANRRVTDRVRLLAALAAKRPTTPGGPACCRTCSAPLMVLPDELLVRCAYCGTDNAVQLRTTIVAEVAASAKQLHTTVVEAAQQDRANRHRTRVLLGKELFRYLWPMVVFAVMFGIADDAWWPPVVCGLLLIGLVLFSGRGNDDSAQRREGNDVADWATYVGPPVVLFLMWFYSAHC